MEKEKYTESPSSPLVNKALEKVLSLSLLLINFFGWVFALSFMRKLRDFVKDNPVFKDSPEMFFSELFKVDGLLYKFLKQAFGTTFEGVGFIGPGYYYGFVPSNVNIRDIAHCIDNNNKDQCYIEDMEIFIMDVITPAENGKVFALFHKGDNKSELVKRFLKKLFLLSPFINYLLSFSNAYRKTRIEKLEKDFLTGFFSRSGFEANFDSVKESFDGKAIILFFDLNGFKQVNEALGHSGGDEVLKFIGNIFKKHFRDQDMLVRWGGDEFVIVINCGDQDCAMAEARLAERLDAIEKEINERVQTDTNFKKWKDGLGNRKSFFEFALEIINGFTSRKGFEKVVERLSLEVLRNKKNGNSS